MNTPLYTRRRLVLAAVQAEPDSASRLEDRGNADGAFARLERAHVTRLVGAATRTALGWLPRGNTGGANVSPFRRMQIPDDLQQQIDRFRSQGAL